MKREKNRRSPSFKAPKFFWTLLGISVVLFCLLDDLKMALDKEAELETMKQEHIEEVMRGYVEYAKKRNDEERRLYQDSIDSISTDQTTDSL